MNTALNAAQSIELIMCISFFVLGLSHLLQPAMWVTFFTRLHAEGEPGVIKRTFMFELWPAMLIPTLHPVWEGPGALLTAYGWLLLGKVVVSLLYPQAGLRSLATAQRGARGFYVAGMMLLMLSGVSAAALWA